MTGNALFEQGRGFFNNKKLLPIFRISIKAQSVFQLLNFSFEIFQFEPKSEKSPPNVSGINVFEEHSVKIIS